MSMKNLKEKIDSSLKKFLSFAGYVLYIYNRESMNCKLIPLPKIEPVLRIRNTGEVFQLGTTSLFLLGKPLFVVLRGVPYALEFKLTTVKDYFVNFLNVFSEDDEKVLKMKGIDLTKLIEGLEKIEDKDKTFLVLRNYSSDEIDAKIHSVYTQRVFRPPKLSVQSIVMIVLFVITSCIITYMVASMYFMSIIDGLETTIQELK